MQTEQLNAFEERFDFAAWKGIDRLGGDKLVRDVTLPANLVEGLDPTRIREIDPGDGSRLLRVSWLVPEKKTALLVMDIRECASREAAHQILLEILANMQAPGVKRLEDNPLGDIAFARDPTAAVVFARCNIVLNIQNGGEEIVSVNKVASIIDDWIMGLPPERAEIHPIKKRRQE